MGLYSALYAGVSGLSANASAMAGVADNITNLNTNGYKGVDNQFRSLVTENRVQRSYVAGGVTAAPRVMVSQQGLLQATGTSTDLGIEGGGFFVARAGSDPASAASFTRAGSFRPDDAGFLRNSGGYYLQGWRLDARGGYASTGSIDSLEPVRVQDLSGTAAPTSKIALRANLESTTPAFAGTYAAGAMATGAVTPHFSRGIQIFDAQGGAHQVNANFLKTGVNQWAVELVAVPASDVAAADGLIAAGSLTFNPDGSLNLAASDPALGQPLAVQWTNGAGNVPIALDLGRDGTIDGITQYAAPSALLSASADGGPLGNVASVEVSRSGLVSAIFEDGTARAVFQLPLATFPNPDGLARLPGNSFGISSNSGNYVLNEPGVLGTGTVAGGTLEASTVDLAAEFSDMIRFQRAYSAASRIITTVDDMLQEASALKR